MASLRRLPPLDATPNSSSNPAHCTNGLTRHYSLPNLYLCQPELSVKALRNTPSSPHKCARHNLPHCIESPSLHTLTLCSKLPLCRALSSSSFDELRHFNIPAADVCGLFARPTGMCVGPSVPSFPTSSRKEGLVAVGKQSLDLENSIVYSELKESMWKFEAPPRFVKPSSVEGEPGPASHTHIHEASIKPMKTPDFHLERSRHGVKERPLSLRMLKRKLSQVTPQTPSDTNPYGHSSRLKRLNEKCPSPSESKHDSKPHVVADASDSVYSAFASLFYIMKILQQYAHSLRIRSCIFESDQSCYENLVGRACMEMLDSFLWLFQQVFSCTPGLMLLTMVLLADFALHSMSMHVAFPVLPSGQPPTPANFPPSKGKSVVAEATVIDAHNFFHYGPEEKWKVQIVPSKSRQELWHEAHSRVVENGDHARTLHRGSDAEDLQAPQTKAIAEGRAIVNGDNTHGGGVIFSSLSSSSLHHAHTKQSESVSERKEIDGVDVPMKLLVAPVWAPTLEPDNYPCFDRTDLAYQHEISMDPKNPLLLSNYAQFLHLVRHDYGRAEELYKRAVSVEADVDGDVMARFASFLWVAKGDVAEADRLFKAATTVDPTNAYHAGNYAHFLWNSSAGQA